MKSYTPTRRLFVLLSLLALLAIGCFLWDWFALIWLMGLITVVLAVIAEAVMMASANARLQDHRLSHQPNVQTPVTLNLSIQASMHARVRLAVEAIQSDLLLLQSRTPDLEIAGDIIEARWQV